MKFTHQYLYIFLILSIILNIKGLITNQNEIIDEKKVNLNDTSHQNTLDCSIGEKGLKGIKGIQGIKGQEGFKDL